MRAMDSIAGLTAGAGSSLEFGKHKSSRWRPGLDMPEWWGVDGASCGGTVACKNEGDRITYVPVLCKRFACEVCSWYRHAWLVRNIVAAMQDHGLTRFWTLTLKTGSRTPDESFTDLQAAWRKLLGRLTRKYGHITYVWVVETTKAGYAHLHLLVNKYIPQREMSAMWLQVTGDSFMVFVRRLEGKEAAVYLAKYVGKEARARADRGAAVAGHHLFGKSANVMFGDFMPKSDGWQVVKVSWRDNAAWLRRYCVVLGSSDLSGLTLTVAAAHGNEWLKSWGWPPGVPRPAPDQRENTEKQQKQREKEALSC